MPTAIFRPLSYLGWLRQSAKGSAGAPTKFAILKKQGFTPDQKVSEYRAGNGRDLVYAVKESFSYMGSFQTPIYPDEGTSLLALLMGKDTISGASDPYMHTLSLQEPLPYACFEAMFYDTQAIDRVADCKIAKGTITWEATKELIGDFDIMGCTPAVQVSAATVTFNNGAGNRPYMAYDGVFTLTGPTDAATLGLQVKKAVITIDQGVTAEYGPGQIQPIEIFEGPRKISVKLTCRFSGPNILAWTYYGANNGTGPSSVVTTGSFDLKSTQQASPEHSLDISLPNNFFEAAPPQFDANGAAGLIDLTLVAYKSGATLPLAVVSKNAVSTAYTA